MLTRKNDAPLDFDFDKVLEQSRDNPVFYVQYAHARVIRVLRKAAEAGIAVDDATLAAADLSGLDHEAELARGRASSPNGRVWSKLPRAPMSRTAWRSTSMNWPAISTRCGTGATMCPTCASCRRTIMATSQAKIALARAVAVVISAGLGILGVTPAEEMR